jgi:hypothetical protein
MAKVQPDGSLSDAEILARMERGIQRSLATPPKPHKMMPKRRKTKAETSATDAKSENPSE